MGEGFNGIWGTIGWGHNNGHNGMERDGDIMGLGHNGHTPLETLPVGPQLLTHGQTSFGTVNCHAWRLFQYSPPADSLHQVFYTCVQFGLCQVYSRLWCSFTEWSTWLHLWLESNRDVWKDHLEMAYRNLFSMSMIRAIIIWEFDEHVLQKLEQERLGLRILTFKKMEDFFKEWSG